MNEQEAPDPVDIHVGKRLHARRLELGLSQETLAGHAGITYQQIQKYEHGMNRISASRLFKLAGALGVSPGWFFEGLTPDGLPIASGKQVSLPKTPSADSQAGANRNMING